MEIFCFAFPELSSLDSPHPMIKTCGYKKSNAPPPQKRTNRTEMTEIQNRICKCRALWAVGHGILELVLGFSRGGSTTC